ncbi:MAG: hypothetical protein D3903_00615 [Candidatus Electrothrix sp. GM3_4]|nr:hypothetical protein [Candidatus Electrothrix sp. GM3_4]
MTDFKESFRQGMQAAKTVDEDKKEIQTVFDELNRQLYEQSEGELCIERKDFFMKGVLQNVVDVLNAKRIKKYSAIAASNPKIPEADAIELARWKTDRNGYPCQIDLDGEQMYCEDKIALENTLNELLRDPEVGAKLYKVMTQDVPINDKTDNNTEEQDD